MSLAGWDTNAGRPPRLLTASELCDLAARRPPPETVGPGGEVPLLAVRLEGCDPALADWLGGLACPVIGVGAGPLGEACDVVLPDPAALAVISRNVARAPMTAMVLVQLLRLGRTLDMAAALRAESLAFGVVQAGPEFSCWRTANPPCPVVIDPWIPPLLLERDDEVLRLAFNRPQHRNAIGVEMRDALAEAFDLALADRDITRVELSGRGRCFSVGGEVREFGLSTNPATAHWVRSVRLPALRLPALGPRLHVRVQGAAIGAGIEIAAFAHRIVAHRNAWFQLPELGYGLIPGAGGTVSLPRRIGRQRTALMALSMMRLPAVKALEWGLIDAVED